MTLGQELAGRREQTKAVKAICAGLLVTVKTSVMGTCIEGHSDEVLRAKAKLIASGYTVGIEYDDAILIYKN